MARILLIASDELSRDYHAYQLSDRGHAVRWVNLSPQLSEEITSFQPEVIVADLSDEYAPSDLLWRTIADVPEASPAVIYSPDAVSWGAFFLSQSGKYAMRSPEWAELNKIMETVLNNQGGAAPTGVTNELSLMEG